MTPQELFDMLMAYPQPTRTEILNHLEELTRNYEPERVEALLADFADILFSWKCGKTYDRAKREYDERERQHLAEYDERYSAFEVRLNFAEYALAMGTNEPIEWPEEPEPYEPLPFIPPMPGTIADNIHIPVMYNYAVEVLKSHFEKSSNESKSSIPENTKFSESQQIIIDKAIAAGFMEPTPIGYKWLYGGAKSKVRLAYFLMRLFFNNEVPNKEMESVFNVKRIDGALNQARSQKAQDWAYRIEELFP